MGPADPGHLHNASAHQSKLLPRPSVAFRTGRPTDPGRQRVRRAGHVTKVLIPRTPPEEVIPGRKFPRPAPAPLSREVQPPEDHFQTGVREARASAYRNDVLGHLT
eukprot:3486683-Alexandrium_andersonii.AAC.2